MQKFHSADSDVPSITNNSTVRLGAVGSIVRCKYCGIETLGIANHRAHVAARHVRKIFIENTSASRSSGRNTAASRNKPAPQSSSGNSTPMVQLVINIGSGSSPVQVLRLGPTLPEWLVRLQPSYAMLDVALDEGRPLMAGESIVVPLPLPNSVPTGSVKSKTIRISYSSDNM